MPYLTGESQQGICIMTMAIPNDVNARRAVAGAILDLTLPRFWEQYGTLTAEQQADAFRALWSTLTFTCYDRLVDDTPGELVDDNNNYMVA